MLHRQSSADQRTDIRQLLTCAGFVQDPFGGYGVQICIGNLHLLYPFCSWQSMQVHATAEMDSGSKLLESTLPAPGMSGKPLWPHPR